MAINTTHPLVDGSLLADARKAREELRAKMAADLVRYGAHGDERAAMRMLSHLGYAVGDIVDLVDDARALAAQEAAAAARVKP
jgi:hypothetical protein